MKENRNTKNMVALNDDLLEQVSGGVEEYDTDEIEQQKRLEEAIERLKNKPGFVFPEEREVN